MIFQCCQAKEQPCASLSNICIHAHCLLHRHLAHWSATLALGLAPLVQHLSCTWCLDLLGCFDASNNANTVGSKQSYAHTLAGQTCPLQIFPWSRRKHPLRRQLCKHLSRNLDATRNTLRLLHTCICCLFIFLFSFIFIFLP